MRRAVATGRRGVTLLEIIVALAIIVVIAGAIFLVIGSSSRTGGDARRVDEAAATLAKLATALAKYSNLPTDPQQQSFAQVMGGITSGFPQGGVNAGRLSHLTTKILTTDTDSCNTVYSFAQANRWIGPFYPTPISTAGLKLAEGFFADDLLVRYNQLGVITRSGTPTIPGTLAIVIPNVALEDARALQQAVEGDQTGGVNSVVRFNPNGDLPVTVSYHVNIHGC